MRAGELRNRGIIQKQDNSGSVPSGSRTWYTYATVWAMITPTSGNETVDQGTKKTQSDVTHIIKIRFLQGLRPTMRFSFDGRLFMFRVIRNIEERDRTVEIEAREETDV